METKDQSNHQNGENKTVARFECKASAGIGYAYWMHVEYKNPTSNSTWEADWKYSDKLGSVCLGQTDYITLRNVSNLKAGAKVRYHMEVKGSSKDQIASEEFIYMANSQWQATYDGQGSLLKPRLEFKGCSLFSEDKAIGFCRPIEDLPGFDHTYVQTADIYYKCHGGVDNGKQICSGMSDVNFSEQMAKGNLSVIDGVKINDGDAGISYLVTGVCHQIANRLLIPARILVNKASGYIVSFIFYGHYGLGKRPILTEQCDKNSYLHKLDNLYLKLEQGEISENEYNLQDISMFFELKLGSESCR